MTNDHGDRRALHGGDAASATRKRGLGRVLNVGAGSVLSNVSASEDDHHQRVPVIVITRRMWLWSECRTGHSDVRLLQVYPTDLHHTL